MLVKKLLEQLDPDIWTWLCALCLAQGHAPCHCQKQGLEAEVLSREGTVTSLVSALLELCAGQSLIEEAAIQPRSQEIQG